MAKENKKLKHVVIFEDMKKKIFTEDIKPGDKLPSENELAKKYNVSRQTVRKAIANLESAGYAYAEHGRGTFCSEMLAHTKSSKNMVIPLCLKIQIIPEQVRQNVWKSFLQRIYKVLLLSQVKVTYIVTIQVTLRN